MARVKWPRGSSKVSCDQAANCLFVCLFVCSFVCKRGFVVCLELLLVMSSGPFEGRKLVVVVRLYCNKRAIRVVRARLEEAG